MLSFTRSESCKTCRFDPLIKTNKDITPDSGREVDLSFEVEFDANCKRGVLEVAVGVDWSPEEVSYRHVSRCDESGKGKTTGYLPTEVFGVPERPGMGRWLAWWPWAAWCTSLLSLSSSPGPREFRDELGLSTGAAVDLTLCIIGLALSSPSRGQQEHLRGRHFAG